MSKPYITLKKRQKKDGTYPLYLRFSQGKFIFRESIGVDVALEQWDPDRRVLRGRTQLAKSKNLILQTSLGRASEIIAAYHLAGKQLTPEKFKEEFHNHASRTDFIHFWEEEMNMQYNRRVFGDAVYIAEERTLEKLKAWMKDTPLLFSEINRKLIERFDEWHTKNLRERGYEGYRERDKSLRQIRKYLEVAKREGKEFLDPFKGFKWPKYNRLPVWLEEGELRKLIAFYKDLDKIKEALEKYAMGNEMRAFDVRRFSNNQSAERIRKYLRAFLFQCFTGVRDSDLRRLTHEEHLKNDMLVFTPQKTQGSSGKKVFFPVTPIIRSLITTTSGALIWVPSNQKYNKQLKLIAELTSIDKRLTTHIGRHTFAAQMVANGVSLISLMDLMGVTSLRTVMVYAHSGLEQQKKEILRAQNLFV